MEPILAIWDGLYLNGYANPPDLISQADLEPYVQDTLNELEFIMGPVSSTYGALRAKLGYPQPWTIKYVEIGNEDNIGYPEPSYVAYRYAAFANAIQAKYPDITVMSSTGDFEAVSPGSATDYHNYNRPDIFVSIWDRWDNLAEAEHLTLIGEFASIQGNVLPIGTPVDWSAPRVPWPTWVGSVAEAIFEIGAERNSYGILGMSYAPTLQNVNNYQWTPDLISFSADNSADVLSTSYHVIQLFSNSRYTSTVPTTITSNDTYGPNYWVAGTSGPGKFTLKAAVYNATETQAYNVKFDGLATGAKATLTVLNAPDGLSNNVYGGPDIVSKTVSTIIAGSDGVLAFELENYAVAVLTT